MLPGGYAFRKAPGNRTILLHRLLAGAEQDCVDHANCDRLDNRRRNLRLCDHRENNRNSRAKSQLGLKGLTRTKRGKWGARIRTDAGRLHLGTFNSPEEAAKAYDAAALKYHGRFARLNFAGDALCP
jgi:hypothetical protein